MKALLFGFAMLLISCGPVPVLNIVDKPIDASPSLSLELIYEAIDLATSQLGWELKEIKPGLALATLHSSNRMAQVQIAYTPQKYSITYEKSNRLKYDGENIHKNFNRWIKNLDKHIRRNLGLVRKIVNIKETRIAVAYDVAFDLETLESDDAMDSRFETPIGCDGSSSGTAFDAIILAVCISTLIVYAGTWTLDEILYADDTKEWQSCLERLSASLRALDGLAMLKPPVHTFLDTHKLTPTIELNSVHENIYRVAREKQVLTPKFKLEFSIKGPEIKNIGDDGLVTLQVEGAIRNIDIDLSHDLILKDWRKDSHQSLTKLCEGQTDNLIKQQINGLIESLLKQMSIEMPRMNFWVKAAMDKDFAITQ